MRMTFNGQMKKDKIDKRWSKKTLQIKQKNEQQESYHKPRVRKTCFQFLFR